MDSERLSAVILNSLDDQAGTGDLARAAYQSRSQFYRLFQALVEENPGRMRRRLLLERAAWQLATTKRAVTEIALDARYGSLEAFTRAFRNAFHISPSLYRRSGCRRIHLPAPNQYHFRPPDDLSKGAFRKMELFELFAGTDSWYTKRLLKQSEGLDDAQLDRPTNGTAKIGAGSSRIEICARSSIESCKRRKYAALNAACAASIFLASALFCFKMFSSELAALRATAVLPTALMEASKSETRFASATFFSLASLTRARRRRWSKPRFRRAGVHRFRQRLPRFSGMGKRGRSSIPGWRTSFMETATTWRGITAR